ncbi:MAG: O-antigen ligase family protein [Caldilineaceae bacterium]
MSPEEKWHRAFHPVVVILTLGMAALAMTFSRGAWAGLAAGALFALYLYWRTGAERESIRRFHVDWLMLGGGATLCLLFGLLLIAPIAQRLEALFPIGSTAVTHLRLWQDSMSLIRDYRYTGSGLGVSAMVYSTYYFLVHVPYLQHAHNLFLQVGVEQGALGMIGFAGLVVVASVVLQQSFSRGNATTRKAGAIGTASLAAMMLHGLTDASLYASSFAMITFLPMGFALSLSQLTDDGKQRMGISIGGIYSTWRAGRRVITGMRFVDDIVSRVTRQQMIGWLAGAMPIVIAMLFVFMWPGSGAAIRANWGAVLQTRAELSIYAWPEWPVQDLLRRTHIVNLEPATSEYRAALKLNPNNVTANRRLGQVALSIGQYDVARRRLEKAHAISYGDQTTVQLLGEVYAIQGQVEQSVMLLGLTPADLQERFQMRKWWYEYIDARQEALWLNQAIAQIERR